MKVPLIIAMQAVESGSTALAMVLAAYGKWVDAETLRSRCWVSRGGTRVEYMAETARSYAMEAEAATIRAEELAAEALPLIVQWKKYNYAVVCAFKDGRIRLNDPKNGTLTLTLDQFTPLFTGRILRLKPGADFVPEGRQKTPLQYVRERLVGAWKIAPLLMVLYALGYLASLGSLVLIQVYLDDVVSGLQTQWAGPLTLMMAVCVAVNFLALAIQRVRLYHFSGKLAAASGAGLVQRLLRLPLRFFEGHFAGELMERMDNNDEIDKMILGTLLPLGIDSLMLIVYLILMFRYNAAVSAVCLALELIYAAASLILQKRIVQETLVLSRVSGTLNAAALNGMETIETIKSMGAESNYFRLWSLSQSKFQNRKLSEQSLRKYQTLLAGIHDALSAAALLFIGAVFIGGGAMSLGVFAALQAMVQILRTKVWAFVKGNDAVQSMEVQIERVDEIMTAEPEAPVPLAEGAPPEKLTGPIVLSGIRYAYSTGDDPVLDDFSLTIAPGQRVGLAGPTGCGKSTLVKLIAGLYAPQAGTITYSGLSRRAIPDAVFYASLSVVDQETVLFEDSIADNLKMWDGAVSDAAMIRAAQDAQIHRLITSRPGGYDARIFDGGRNLSGGERQRMEIARALASDPAVLLMDEATAALDALTEERVVEAVRRRGITCLMVAHRLSSIRDCDCILVMDRGRIVDSGTHDELMDRCALYQKMVDAQ